MAVPTVENYENANEDIKDQVVVAFVVVVHQEEDSQHEFGIKNEVEFHEALGHGVVLVDG